MKVKEIMSSTIEYMTDKESTATAAQKMRDVAVGALPVVDDEGRMVGIVTDRDIVVRAVAESRDPVATTVREVMTPRALSCPADAEVEEAASLMEKEQIRRLIVVDADNKAVGMLALGDIAVKSPGQKLAGEAVEEISKPAMPKRK